MNWSLGRLAVKGRQHLGLYTSTVDYSVPLPAWVVTIVAPRTPKTNLTSQTVFDGDQETIPAITGRHPRILHA